jgi:hypothetical protein
VFDNLIALCGTCHTRYDTGQIDRLAMRRYKANLSVLNGRYSDLERRVLQQFADEPAANAIDLQGMNFHLLYLIRDGLLVDTGPAPGPGGSFVSARIGGVEMVPKRYMLTQRGREFVNHWLAGDELD